LVRNTVVGWARTSTGVYKKPYLNNGYENNTGFDQKIDVISKQGPDIAGSVALGQYTSHAIEDAVPASIGSRNIFLRSPPLLMI
jgi:hypothetical protein